MIRYEKDGHIAVITINRPDARNAVNGTVAKGIEEAIDLIESDREVWVGIITGSGPIFCAGADLKEVDAGNGASLFTERGGFAGLTRRERTKPLIAAVNGHALAGGLEIVLACDLVVATDMADFGLTEVKRSLIAAGGGVFRLPKLIGEKAALEMLLTGDPISSRKALELGMINHVVPHGDLMVFARQLAARICEAAPLAVRESLALAKRAWTDSEAVLFDETMRAMARLGQTEDFREGPKAFVEKRPPQWKAR